MTTPAFTVKESLGFGWRTFKARPWFFAGTVVAYFVIQFLVSMLQGSGLVHEFIAFIVSLGVSTLLYCGLMQIYLKAHDDPHAPTWEDFWNPKPFLNYLGTSILLAIMVILGVIALIIPGIYLALMFSMAGYLVVDRGLGPIEALKESARLTSGQRWKLLLLGVVIFGLGILGSIPLFLGLLVVGPVSMLAAAHVYRALQSSAGAVAPVSPPPAA